MVVRRFGHFSYRSNFRGADIAFDDTHSIHGLAAVEVDMQTSIIVVCGRKSRSVGKATTEQVLIKNIQKETKRTEE